MCKNNAIVLIGVLREKVHFMLETELREAGITDDKVL
jgi:hypothetical protein